MKVVHIVPCAPYNEGWGYQENLLPRYQALNGHEASLIITDKKHEDGKIVDAGECEYMSDNGGNSRFIESADVDSIMDTLNEIIGTEVYDEMLPVAKSEKTDIYLHKVVAVKSMEMAKRK